MSDLTRREMVTAIAAASAGAFIVPNRARAAEVTRLSDAARRAAGSAFAPKVYTPHEWDTVRMLVDYLIPKDARSGSATDAGVPEFMDTMLDLEAGMRVAHRGGLAWLDHQSRTRFKQDFVNATDAQRRQLLDEIAFPGRSRAEMAAGAAWFTSFRDFAVTGFFSSEMGVADLGYMGNTAVAEWTGCPPDNYTRLGVTKP